MGHPLACAAALAVQETIRRDNLLANVRDMGALLRRRLGERFGNHAHVGDIRGRGLFQAIELVEDRADQGAVRSGAASSTRKVKKAAMARGLHGLSHGRHDRRPDAATTCCWRRPSSSPPAQIDEIVDRLGNALDDALA